MTASFPEFFEAVWGYAPFPWQRRLAEQVAAEGWPAVLDLPTGSGKTAALDVALHHLAMDGGRTAPRRVILVVDRRVIVDQVAVRARKLLHAIHAGEHPATRAVRDALRAMVGSDEPLLETAVLRGATLRDDAWAHRPQVPVLAASTVDQVGSRLLFRGYGVSDSMRPVHAGLIGCDTLLLLDEVHLARPFADVLAQLAALRGPEGDVPRRFRVVQLSATPGGSAVAPFSLAPEDRSNERLARCLGASKPAKLDAVKVLVSADEADKRQAVAERAAKHARALIAEGRRAVAVVVNRVDTARRAWACLEDDAFDRVLLTGRMRPLDQQVELERVESRVHADRVEAPSARPLVLVATQCIEAGADFDFDGMVTECASLDALRQRFGRVDRRGERPARGVIVARSDQLGGVGDPVYGDALKGTWNWLSDLASDGGLDFGIDALEPHLDRLGDGVDSLRAPSQEAPVVLPAYLDQWVQTNPRPHADPDVSLFLHGIPEDARGAIPDVQVVWRADITEDDLERAEADHRECERLAEQLGAAPPGTLEAVSLPVWTAKRWLATVEADSDEDIADVDGLREEGAKKVSEARRVLVWRGRRDSEVVPADKLKPGWLVVVPASVGGIGLHGTFDGTPRDAVAKAAGKTDSEGSVPPVSDLGDAVQLYQRGRPTLRLDERVIGGLVGKGFTESLPNPEDEQADVYRAVREALEAALAADAPDAPKWFEAIRAELRRCRPRPRLMRAAGADGAPRWTALGRRLSAQCLRERLGGEKALLPPPADVTTEGDDGSFTGVRSTLEAHLAGVGAMARGFGERVALPPRVTAALEWAGRIHDVGKVDRRFQLWLHGGDEVAASRGEPLAKSTTPRQDRAARRRARERAGYPRGQRHELVSLDMIERSERLRGEVEAAGADWELVLHLVASHHGWCRPLAPPVAIGAEHAEDVSFAIGGVPLHGTTAHERWRMDSGVVDRFWRLVRRYGWHELAYLEAILRLADHRRSEQEQGETP